MTFSVNDKPRWQFENEDDVFFSFKPLDVMAMIDAKVVVEQVIKHIID